MKLALVSLTALRGRGFPHLVLRPQSKKFTYGDTLKEDGRRPRNARTRAADQEAALAWHE
jgi:hypothetical protein